MSEQHTFFRISPALQGICEEVTASLREIFSQIEETTEYNQQKVLAAFIETYHPSWFTRVGLRYVNAFRRAPLGLEDCLWKELITPGFLGLMGDEDAQEQAFMKNELTATVQMPGGAKANVKSGPGLLRKVNNRTRETTEERVFMLDLDLYMDSKIELNHTAPALNIVHDNAGSLFRAAITDTLADAMEPQKA